MMRYVVFVLFVAVSVTFVCADEEEEQEVWRGGFNPLTVPLMMEDEGIDKLEDYEQKIFDALSEAMQYAIDPGLTTQLEDWAKTTEKMMESNTSYDEFRQFVRQIKQDIQKYDSSTS